MQPGAFYALPQSPQLVSGPGMRCQKRTIGENYSCDEQCMSWTVSTIAKPSLHAANSGLPAGHIMEDGLHMQEVNNSVRAV